MVTSGESQRWHGQKSSFSWEQDALDFIKKRMPDAEPYRAWQTFTFTAPSGHVREVDLLLAAPGGLFLIEIKSHPGVATNHGSTWLFRDSNVTRTIENPLHFTDLKAKELRNQLQKAADEIARGLEIPRIEAAVFLSAESLRCRFDGFQKQRVYGRDGRTAQTDLESIWAGFLNQPPRSEKNRVTPTISKQLPKLLSKIGISRLHKRGKVGVYELRAKSFDAGPTWEDYLADNPSLSNDEPRRVRVYLAGQTATDEDRTSTQRAARREYLALQGISHDGIVRAEQYSDELLAGPAVVFRHGEDWQRLDHFIAARPEQLPVETKLEMIRQLAEALDHAHRRHLYHRALAPRSVYVEMDGRYPRLRIADWQVAARPHSTSTPGTRTSTQLSGPAALLKHIERSAGPYLAPEFTTPDAPPALLDMFGLGALSYLILTGSAPADNREQLAQRLNGTPEHALTPSSVADSISPQLDVLVQKATARHQAERTGTVREFLKELDRIEEALTAPEAHPAKDPLSATRGDVVEGWTVERILGKGSTSRALLVTKDDSPPRVFKVALNEAAGRRLKREAEQLDQLNDSHVARLLDSPFQAGPPEHRRTVIGVEYVGDHTLAEELRRGGPRAMTINELERLGEDLFQAVTFLDKRGIWHRDIKPDNLALRKLPKKGRELVLFDFSLAGVPDTELAVGTRDYLDPFLGPPNRNRYDQAAELYAVAVTLHEMVSGELPSWGDGITPAGFLDTNEEVQLAEDVFDPVIRDGLVKFFRKALHRDAAQRFTSLRAMTRAWTEIFKDVETVPPLTTSATQDDEDETDERTREAAEAKREAAARSAIPETPLVAAGLSPYALSTALQHLGLSTAGDLARTPAKRITSLKGIGRVPKFELVRRSMEWRQRFNLSKGELPRPDIQESHDPERTGPTPRRSPTSEPGDAAEAGATAVDMAHLSVDEVARRLVPDSPQLRQVTGLASGRRGWTSPWASRQEAARDLGMSVAEVAMNLDRLHARWTKSVPALRAVRDQATEILLEHGRVLSADEVAAALLTLRGSERDDPAERLKLAALCVRAAVETEERLDKPRLLSRRVGSGVLVTLTDAGEEGTAPRAEDLFAYAELLGEQADALSARDPLPGGTEVRQVLRKVGTADHATRLSDTDLVRLAAAASGKTAATARLELYPRDLPKLRALKLSQAGSLLGTATEAQFVRRVLARFPDLTDPPKVEEISGLLRELGYDTEHRSDGLLYLRSSAGLSGLQRFTTQSTSMSTRVEALARAYRRLAEARQRGGFIAVKTYIESAAATCGHLAAMDGVTAVDVTAVFVRLLHEVVDEQGRPRWEVVLAADSPSASPAARTGFAALLGKTWERFDTHIRAIGNECIVLLHDATPLARYSGGMDVLAKLAVAARDSGESPHGLWLLCPMAAPKAPPRLDGVTVGVIPGDAEQLYVPDGFGGKEQKAS